MRVLVTGHTGFKGAWLSLWLAHQGHSVHGLALDPEPGSLFELAAVSDVLDSDHRCDIRDPEGVKDVLLGLAPDVVIHMAAQSLVRPSYQDPRGTIETNVMGTLSVLEAVREAEAVKACLVVTTDKVYRNVGQLSGYVEDDSLGGSDPYSASKAMADILTTSWAMSFPGPALGIARAGNVIGGGDISRDRLMPDVVRAIQDGRPIELRYPEAVRPWQHVLDCLSGYVALVNSLLAGSGHGPWNFGPDPQSFRSVRETVEVALNTWGEGGQWVKDEGQHPHEEHVLTLDATRARSELGWTDRLDYETAVRWTMEWESRVRSGEDPREVTLDQIRRFDALSDVS